MSRQHVAGGGVNQHDQRDTATPKVGGDLDHNAARSVQPAGRGRERALRLPCCNPDEISRSKHCKPQTDTRDRVAFRDALVRLIDARDY